MFSVLALFTLCCCKQWLFIRDLSPTIIYLSDFRNFFGVRCSIGRDIANITVLRILYSDCLLRYFIFTRIVFSSTLMRLPKSIVYMTLCNSPGLQRVHISAKQIFHAPLQPSNNTFLSPRFWETRDQRSPGSFPSARRGRAWVRGCH